MKVIIVHIGDINKYPPVSSLINALEEKGIPTLVVTSRSSFNSLAFSSVSFRVLDFDYEKIESPLRKLMNIFNTRPAIDRILAENCDDDTVIWITYTVSLKHMNMRKLKHYHYVLQLMELQEEIKFHAKLPLKINAPDVAQNAVAVVVPEYNRAHITKAWWELKQLPLVLPNKPFLKNEYEKNNYIEDIEARAVIDRLNGKKIILYQGILTRERPMDVLINAVDQLGDDYAFVVMSSGENIYRDVKSRNYYFIPFVKPPYHLQVTSHAYIGVLTYVSVKSDFSKLNVLYCAPNKTFEYGMFGIPMLGNDLPGLKFLFETEQCGACYDDWTVESIIQGVRDIEQHYGAMSNNSRSFYDKTDYRQALERVLSTVRVRIADKKAK